MNMSRNQIVAHLIHLQRQPFLFERRTVSAKVCNTKKDLPHFQNLVTTNTFDGRLFATCSKACSRSASASSTKGASGIPVIDFSKFLSPLSYSEIAPSNQEQEALRLETARKLVNAFKSSGFVYLTNHSLTKQEVQEAFNASASFFALPDMIKERLAWRDPRANRGYVRPGRERVTNETDPEKIEALRNTSPDVKESLEIGREKDAEFENYWPTESELAGFRATMLKFRAKADQLHLEILRAIAIGLDLPPDFFDDKCHEEWHTLRLLHYPPTPTDSLNGGGSRAGAHTDYGSLTLLFQDNVGGLEVQDPATGEFIPAHPIEDSIVINVGDLLSRWSNDRLRSTLHRVVKPTHDDGSGMTPRRYSIAYFMNPNEHQLVEALPSCVDKKHPAKYKSVRTDEYLAQRLRETYA